uniref:Uncharacterized protein n=1 Tax=Timema monikensis TaxID=170555 RepID=A0A7R9EA83_9NEOP|nr:unnamed protein product [Timema monikensis]
MLITRVIAITFKPLPCIKFIALFKSRQCLEWSHNFGVSRSAGLEGHPAVSEASWTHSGPLHPPSSPDMDDASSKRQATRSLHQVKRASVYSLDLMKLSVTVKACP